MSWNRNYSSAQLTSTHTRSSFASLVYNWLSLGLGFTAAVAYVIYAMGWDVMLAPLWFFPMFGLMAIAFSMQRGVRTLTFGQMAALYFTYAGLEGLFFGIAIPQIALQSGVETVWLAFASAAVSASTAVLYGHFTRADLTQMRSLFATALWGLLAVSVTCAILSFFMPIGPMQLVIAFAGLILFLGLAATDAQQIQRLSRQLELEGDSAPKLSLLAALSMYANVIMIFWYLLQLLSATSRRND